MGQPTLIEMLWEIALRNGIHCCYCCSVPKSCQTLRPHRLQQATLSCPSLSPSLLKLMSIESITPSNHLILYCPLLLPSIFPSIRLFSNELALHIRWPNNWSFSFSISPSHEYSRLVSFRIDSFDLLAVQRTLKSLLQHHSSKASILWCPAFFIVQLSHLHMTTGKTIALLYGQLLAKWYLCFLIECLGLL